MKNPSKAPKTGTYSHKKNRQLQKYDTSPKKCDTAPIRIYKVNRMYYYRRKINKKLYRLSLRTKNLKVAIQRKKLLDLLSMEEFVLTIQAGDYKYIFEYDTVEEALEYAEKVKELHKKDEIKKEYERANELLNKAANKEAINWLTLEAKFIANKRNIGKVGESTYKAYASTFSKLKKFFTNKPLDSINIEQYDEFRNYLKNEEGLKAKTINNHTKYVNQFLNWAITYKLIKENNAKGLESFKEDPVNKENYTNEEMQKILTHKFKNKQINIVLNILAYTGMRISEVHNLEKDCVREEDGIKYFNVKKGKTKNATRKVPVHKNLEKILEEVEFPLFKNKTADATEKYIIRYLYKIINKGETKTLHTFRGTFISRALNNFPEKLLIIQEIIGHKKSEKEALTIDTYAKGFSLKLKDEVVQSVNYF